MWMNPPIVYEVTNPSAHMIKRITKIVQSMFQLLSGYKPITSNLLSARCLSPFFLVRLFFFFRGGVNRAAAMTHEGPLSDNVRTTEVATAPVPLIVFVRVPATVSTTAFTISPVPLMALTISPFTDSIMLFCAMAPPLSTNYHYSHIKKLNQLLFAILQ
jgi:hypothetical protein